MTQQKKRLKATKKNMRFTLYVTLFIFVASLSFLISSILQNIPSPTEKNDSLIHARNSTEHSENSFIPNDIADDTHHLIPNTHNQEHLKITEQNSLIYSNLSKIFDANSLNNNLIPQISNDITNKLTSAQQELTRTQHVTQSSPSFDIFTFSSVHATNPMDLLVNIIVDLYTQKENSINQEVLDSKNTNDLEIFHLLYTAQNANLALTKTLEDCAIFEKDILFLESAIRVDNKLTPYPFLIIELRHHDNTKTSPYFITQKLRDHFLQTLNTNIKKFHNNSISPNTKNQHVQVVDEGSFIYITFENIISHVIRLEKRQDRLQKINPLDTSKVYCSLIIDDFGENYSLARKFMDLPFPVIFSIWPQSTHSTKIATIAHEKGLPIFLHQPMQAMPLNNKKTPNMGKAGLTTDMTQEEMKATLQHNILSVPHARGINNHMGSLFTSTPYAVESFLRALKSLMPQFFIVDSVTHARSTLFERARDHNFLVAKRHYFIDNNDQNIAKELQNAYEFAKKNGHVYAIGHARQKTLSVLQNWDVMQDKNLIFTLPTY